jgi:hypothetical protein
MIIRCSKSKNISDGLFLAAWMVAVVDFFGLLPGDESINLRGRDVGVAEQQLHRAQVGAALDQVGGKGMAQYGWLWGRCLIFTLQ